MLIFVNKGKNHRILAHYVKKPIFKMIALLLVQHDVTDLKMVYSIIKFDSDEVLSHMQKFAFSKVF